MRETTLISNQVIYIRKHVKIIGRIVKANFMYVLSPDSLTAPIKSVLVGENKTNERDAMCLLDYKELFLFELLFQFSK